MNAISEQISKLIALGRTIQVVDSLNELAWEIRRNDINHAYQASVKGEEISIELNYENGLQNALKVQGYCLWRFSDYPASMEKSTNALKIAEKRDDKKGQADILNCIGAVYMFLKDNENRLKCNLRCLAIRKQINDIEGISGSLNNTGETYLEMGEYDKAEDLFNQCLDYTNTEVDSKGWAYHNLGLLNIKLGNERKAIEELNKSIEITKDEGYNILTCNGYYQLGLSFFRQSNFEESKKQYSIALSLAFKMGAKEEMKNIHLAYSELYEREGDIKEAYDHFKKYNEIHNLLYNERNDDVFQNLKNQYEVESLQKEAEIERLKNIELKKAFNEIDNQKKLLEKKNQSIQDSIQYAQRIQEAILENEYELDETELDYFNIFKPKDVVSGDFYWSKLVGSHFYLAVVDCTGHGVPGAFMSMLGVAFLNEITGTSMLPSTHNILDSLREKVITVLKQSGNQFSNSDGMDMSIIRLDLDTLEMQYSGAMNSIYVLRDGELLEVKADRMGIGYSVNMKPFNLEFVDLEKGDQFFMFSDGYADQFGGDKDRKIGYKNFREWLIESGSLEVSLQKEFLENKFNDWKGSGQQIDDVCLIGVKV